MATYTSDSMTPLVAVANAVPDLAEVGGMSGRVRAAVGNVVPTAAVAAGDILNMCVLPSGARIVELWVEADDLGGATTTWDVGLYNMDDSVVDINLYGVALDGATALAAVDVRFQTLNHNTRGQKIWEDLGLSEDPMVKYKLAGTMLVVATGLVGDVSYKVFWTVD